VDNFTLTQKERADKFATFVSAITEYHKKFDSVMETLMSNHPEPDQEAFEDFKKVVPVIDIEPLVDTAFRDGVIVWSLKQARQDPNIIKSIGAILLRPFADESRLNFSPTKGVSEQAKLTATDVVCMLLMAGGGFEPAFPLMASNRFRMVANNVDNTDLHEMLTTALLLGSIDPENARQSVLGTILDSDNDELWDKFQVELDEKALWADLEKGNADE
jgi:hypothetical protein